MLKTMCMGNDVNFKTSLNYICRGQIANQIERFTIKTGKLVRMI
jgi:hypothetical protein